MILIVIMLVSGFLAMVRGFTREVLSIFSWAVAAVAALYLTPKYWHTVEPYFPSPSFAQIAFAVGVFIIALILVSLITFRISDKVLDSRVGALDRTLGFIFGLARGFLLVAIVFILFTALARDQPEWVTNARSYPILQRTQVAIEVAAAHESRAISAWWAREGRGHRRPAWRSAGRSAQVTAACNGTDRDAGAAVLRALGKVKRRVALKRSSGRLFTFFRGGGRG